MLRFGLDGGEPRTLGEVGVHFELSRERIRQIEAKAMAKLRHAAFDVAIRDRLSAERAASKEVEDHGDIRRPGVPHETADGLT